MLKVSSSFFINDCPLCKEALKSENTNEARECTLSVILISFVK